MAKRANTLFHDEEIQITLPDAFALYHVDAPQASWSQGWQGKRVDWAWEEPNHYFLCGLKDPDCLGASQHPPPHGSHKQAVLAELSASPNAIAQKAEETIRQHPPTQSNKKPLIFIVLIAISDPAFDSAVQQTAAGTVERELLRKGVIARVVVVNLASWNTLLGPRSINRVP